MERNSQLAKENRKKTEEHRTEESKTEKSRAEQSRKKKSINKKKITKQTRQEEASTLLLSTANALGATTHLNLSEELVESFLSAVPAVDSATEQTLSLRSLGAMYSSQSAQPCAPRYSRKKQHASMTKPTEVWGPRASTIESKMMIRV